MAMRVIEILRPCINNSSIRQDMCKCTFVSELAIAFLKVLASLQIGG
jgi:hypothetical protein